MAGRKCSDADINRRVKNSGAQMALHFMAQLFVMVEQRKPVEEIVKVCIFWTAYGRTYCSSIFLTKVAQVTSKYHSLAQYGVMATLAEETCGWPVPRTLVAAALDGGYMEAANDLVATSKAFLEQSVLPAHEQVQLRVQQLLDLLLLLLLLLLLSFLLPFLLMTLDGYKNKRLHQFFCAAPHRLPVQACVALPLGRRHRGAQLRARPP